MASAYPVESGRFVCKIPFFNPDKMEYGPQIQGVWVDEKSLEVRNQTSMPSRFQLLSISPNPFNGQVRVRFFVPADQTGDATLKITFYNILGQRVNEIEHPLVQAGIHQVIWNGRNRVGQDVASGVYLLEILTKNPIRKKIICVR